MALGRHAICKESLIAQRCLTDAPQECSHRVMSALAGHDTLSLHLDLLFNCSGFCSKGLI